MAKIADFFTWWLWRRWRIYCPKGDVSHLFDESGKLFDYDEAFVSPCIMNEINCGGFRGKWTPKISFVPGMEVKD